MPRLSYISALSLVSSLLAFPATLSAAGPAPAAPVARPAAPPAKSGALPSATELMKAMDSNLQYTSRTSSNVMTVNNGRRTLTYQMQTYGQGKDESAVEYQAPERDKGTKMLKKGDNLWLYMPRAERVQKISGHMLRQGMMGSDISYEDMLASADFEKQYKATVTGEEVIEGRPHWKIEAIALNDTVTYPKRIIWVDKEWLTPTRQELYALSGMKLKTWTMGNVKVIDGHNIPMHMEVSDHLREGSKTTIDVKEMSLGVKLQEEIFSMRWLERK